MPQRNDREIDLLDRLRTRLDRHVGALQNDNSAAEDESDEDALFRSEGRLEEAVRDWLEFIK